MIFLQILSYNRRGEEDHCVLKEFIPSELLPKAVNELMVFIQVERGIFFGTEISFNDFLNNKIVVWGIVKPNEVEDRVLRLRVANSVRIEMRSAHFF